MLKSARLAWASWLSLAAKYSQVIRIANGTTHYLPHQWLFKAVYRGDWDMAKAYLDQHPWAVRVRTPGTAKTALQLAVTEEHLHIVIELLNIMTEQELEIERDDGYTALASAVEVGNLEIAKRLVVKNPRLVGIIQKTYGIPVMHAVLTGQKHMFHYLYSVTPIEVLLEHEEESAASLLSQCILLQHLDIALHLVERAPDLAITEDADGKSPVCALAFSKTFPSSVSLNFWQQWIYNCINVPDSATNYVSIDIQNIEGDQSVIESKFPGIIIICCKKVLLGPLRRGWSYILELLAAKAGNVEFISRMAKANPTLVWNPNIARRVFEVAVENRQAKIFSLIYGLRDKTAIVSYYDETNSNMLHKAAAVAPSRLLKLIPGAALQMQRELHWFKAVQEFASQGARGWTNKDCLTPSALFTENHQKLVEEGEKWMKDTGSSSTVVGALIVTITFAAAFTFPGGYDQNNGFPMFQGNKLFRVFMMSNAVALFTSTTSVLMFLGILTSPYGEEDFLESLPRKLIVGLSTLFLSIAAMVIAFGAGLSLMFHSRLFVVVPSICFACILISFFVFGQFRLLADIVLSTYGPSIFNKNVKRWI